MTLLGAVLAGGRSRRFGSDKANAILEGRRLIDHVIDALHGQCQEVVICGREDPDIPCLPDTPGPDMGPLAGLNAALVYAHRNGFEAVLSSGCDIPNLPPDLAIKLAGKGAAIASDQPVVGLWPAALQPELEAFLASGGRALYAFAEQIGARPVTIVPPLRNVNTADDLAQ